MSENINNVSANEFLRVLESGDMPLVIDVRTVAEVGNEYLDGCVNIPLHELNLSQMQTCVAEKKQQGSQFICYVVPENEPPVPLIS